MRVPVIVGRQDGYSVYYSLCGDREALGSVIFKDFRVAEKSFAFLPFCRRNASVAVGAVACPCRVR